MDDSEYLATLAWIADTCRNLHNEIHVALQAIKNDETGMDDRWMDLYAMMRLVGVTIDLSNRAKDRK